MLDARACLGTHDFVLVTLDSLRFDVASEALRRGLTPNMAELLPDGAWEQRETPGNFTYSAHHAFFAGFLPTPIGNPRHPRLFAARFGGSETTGERTIVFDAPDIVSGFANEGYATICIGGVGFFNKQNPLGCVFPSLFQQSFWSEETGVTSRTSTEAQVRIARQAIQELPAERRVFLFINVSAMHQPNCIFGTGDAHVDSPETQMQALSYADRHLGDLFALLKKRGSSVVVVCSDHGTAYGEDGITGHRNNHPVVLNVPFAEFVLR